MSAQRKAEIAARLTLPERRAFLVLSADSIAEVKKAFHLITDIAAQRVLDAVKEYREGKS